MGCTGTPLPLNTFGACPYRLEPAPLVETQSARAPPATRSQCVHAVDSTVGLAAGGAGAPSLHLIARSRSDMYVRLDTEGNSRAANSLAHRRRPTRRKGQRHRVIPHRLSLSRARVTQHSPRAGALPYCTARTTVLYILHRSEHTVTDRDRAVERGGVAVGLPRVGRHHSALYGTVRRRVVRWTRSTSALPPF